MTDPSPSNAPKTPLNPSRLWRRVSSSLVPVFAVITALIVIIPLMVFTQGGGNLQKGLEISGRAYAGLLEGALGIAVNDALSPDSVQFAQEFVQNANANRETPIRAQDVNILAQRADELAKIGRDNIAQYQEVIDRYLGTEALPDNAAFDRLGDLIPEIRRIGEDRLREYAPLIEGWDALNDLDVRDFGEIYGGLTALTEEQRAYLDALIPALMDYDDDTLLGAFRLMQDFNFALLNIQYKNYLAGDITEQVMQIGEDNLALYGPVYAVMDSARTEGLVNAFINRYGILEDIDSDSRAQIEWLVPQAVDFADSQLLDAIRLLRDRTLIRLNRGLEQSRVLDQLGIPEDSDDAEAIAAIHELSTDNADPNGITNVQRIAEADVTFRAAGIEEKDMDQLAAQLRLVANLYGPVLTIADVAQALEQELPLVSAQQAVLLRPNNQILILGDKAQVSGVLERVRPEVTTVGSGDERTTTTEDFVVTDKVFLKLGNRYLLFSPANLEQTLTRALPYIIAGLAVALGFKAGLFNIGAEGQLYIGATLAAWVGFSSTFGGLPALIHVPLVLMAGMLGGALWGMIPGVLKAYTGAHEVINTIMLNFIAIWFTDWLIKSTDPVILGDPTASAPRTPLIGLSARLVSLDTIGTAFYLLAGGIVALFFVVVKWRAIRKNRMALVRPILYGVGVAVIGLVLKLLTASGDLHIGLAVAVIAVFVVDWFLERTTTGFELRIVGANADAAKYSGMNVRRNVILAMTLSGLLAGLAGIVQIGGVQYSMEPSFFSGLGFDAIAVALLARNNPRNMIPAGILWGALITGTGAIQVYNIPIDLVKIIQALIIMFIAADVIIRFLYRVPEATPEEKAKMVFSTGWGS